MKGDHLPPITTLPSPYPQRTQLSCSHVSYRVLDYVGQWEPQKVQGTSPLTLCEGRVGKTVEGRAGESGSVPLAMLEGKYCLSLMGEMEAKQETLILRLWPLSGGPGPKPSPQNAVLMTVPAQVPDHPTRAGHSVGQHRALSFPLPKAFFQSCQRGVMRTIYAVHNGSGDLT